MGKILTFLRVRCCIGAIKLERSLAGLQRLLVALEPTEGLCATDVEPGALWKSLHGSREGG